MHKMSNDDSTKEGVKSTFLPIPTSKGVKRVFLGWKIQINGVLTQNSLDMQKMTNDNAKMTSDDRTKGGGKIDIFAYPRHLKGWNEYFWAPIIDIKHD